jgi:hypothetical protein
MLKVRVVDSATDGVTTADTDFPETTALPLAAVLIVASTANAELVRTSAATVAAAVAALALSEVTGPETGAIIDAAGTVAETAAVPRAIELK